MVQGLFSFIRIHFLERVYDEEVFKLAAVGEFAGGRGHGDDFCGSPELGIEHERLSV